MGVKAFTIQQSLQYVVNNPEPKTDTLLDLPAHELISRTLFEIANGAKLHDKASMTAANSARTVIFMRLVGRRRAGSHPATQVRNEIEFHDLVGDDE